MLQFPLQCLPQGVQPAPSQQGLILFIREYSSARILLIPFIGSTPPPRYSRCAACETSTIQGARIICTVCSHRRSYYECVELCFGCFASAGKETSLADGRVHTSTHSLVQLREVRSPAYVHPTLDAGQKIRKAAQKAIKSRMAPENSKTLDLHYFALASDGLCCVLCKRLITAAPYWCCLDCQLPIAATTTPGEQLAAGEPVQTGKHFADLTCNLLINLCVVPTLVCYACNALTEREKPWLYQPGPISEFADGLHHWSHSLVAVPEGWDESAAALSAEGRLERLEGKVDELREDFGKLREHIADDNVVTGCWNWLRSSCNVM